MTTRALPWTLAAALALALAALAVQHHRHGWPFSLHHGLAAPDAAAGHASHPPSAAPPTAPSADHEAHAVPGRAPITGDPARWSAAGVALVPVAHEVLSPELRLLATVALDEARVTHVHARVSGFVDKLHVGETGMPVTAGAPVASIFSQDLLAAQAELLALAASPGAGDALLAGARSRLEVLGLTKAQIARVLKTGRALRGVPVLAPTSGVLLRRGVSTGASVDAGTVLASIADLSRVWVIAEVPEADAPHLRPGAIARLTFPGAGDDAISASVAFVAPTLTEATRTLAVRFEVDNADGRLRPGLSGTAVLALPERHVMTVPRDAVVDTGLARHVFVETAPGAAEPRAVRVGGRFGDRVEILEGLGPSDRVVASGVFLIDSESRLRASGGAGGAHGSHP